MATKKLQILGSFGSNVEIDDTLSKKGKAADAKAVGDRFAGITSRYPSTNFFNVDEWVSDKIVQANGLEVGCAGSGHTGFVPVTPGDIVIFGVYSSTTGAWSSYVLSTVAAYDSNKTIVKSAGKDLLYQKSYTVPDGIAYIIISKDGAPNAERAQINCTTDGVSLPYEPCYSRELPYMFEETQAAIKDLEDAVKSSSGSINPIELDTTLTKNGKAADSKVVGDAIAEKSQVQIITWEEND